MAEGTKERIMETARQMFCQRGYNEVSMRNIADELGISVGNVTYHFARKEDLVQAVVFYQHKSYRKTPPVRTLGGLHSFFVKILQNHAENDYYFRHYTQLAQILPKVYKLQRSVMHDMIKTLRGTLAALQMAGLIAPEELPGQHERAAGVLRLIILYGESTIQERLAQLWTLLHPMLTRKGKRVWQAEVQPQLEL